MMSLIYLIPIICLGKSTFSMFESITIFNQDRNNTLTPLDIGALVECMLFYKETTVVADKTILKQLFTYFGIDRVTALIEENLLNIVYTETLTGVHTFTKDGIEHHDAIIVSTDALSFGNALWDTYIEVVGKSGKGRRTAQRIQKLIKVKNHADIILEGARNSFLDANYMDSSAKSIIKSLVPEIENLQDAFFHTEKMENGIIVETNFNFSELNRAYHKRIPPTHSTITSAYILSQALGTESELYFASNNLSEISTSVLSANLLSHKVNYLLEKSVKSSEQLDEFQKFIFDNAKALREAVNRKEIDLDELISVLRNSKRFKEWILGVEPEQNLIKSYYTEVTNKTFVDKLPGKTLRWGLFTCAGMAIDGFLGTSGLGTLAGMGMSALDSFLLDKMISGWKPNYFIENEVRELLTNA